MKWTTFDQVPEELMADASMHGLRSSTIPPTMVARPPEMAEASDEAKKEWLLDWCSGNRVPGDTIPKIAAFLGVHKATIERWKADPTFIRKWEERMTATAAHPEKLTRQLAALEAKANEGDIKAIELYWKLVDKISPTRFEVATATAAHTLTDDELVDALEQARALRSGKQQAIEAHHRPS